MIRSMFHLLRFALQVQWLMAYLHQTAMKANSGTVFITVWELKYLEDTQINIFFFYGPFLMAFIKVEKSIHVLSILTLML